MTELGVRLRRRPDPARSLDAYDQFLHCCEVVGVVDSGKEYTQSWSPATSQKRTAASRDSKVGFHGGRTPRETEEGRSRAAAVVCATTVYDGLLDIIFADSSVVS